MAKPIPAGLLSCLLGLIGLACLSGCAAEPQTAVRLISQQRAKATNPGGDRGRSGEPAAAQPAVPARQANQPAKLPGALGAETPEAAEEAAQPVSLVSQPTQATGRPVATVKVGAGWATFGQVVPRGAAREGLQLGDLTTQTDVKTRWEDGSIRFAVVTAKVRAPGTFKLRPAGRAKGAFRPRPPEASVRFQIGRGQWTAALPGEVSADLWLTGPLAVEWRSVVAPVDSDGKPHPFLRVVFDVRCYNDGPARLDITVENVLNQPDATKVAYDVDVRAGARSVFRRREVNHWYLTRWRKVFPIALKVAAITPDFEPAFRAQALPRYLSLASKEDSFTLPGTKFDLLQCGYLNPDMPAHGGRPELAPYPDWTARYLVHKDAGHRRYVLAYGDLAGSWPVHLREAEKGRRSGIGPGRLVSLGERPNFWLDGAGRGDKGENAEGDLKAQGPLRPDNNHVPSLAYVPYLVTGDRYYADEMAFWANYALLSTFQDAYYKARGGSAGLLAPNEPRGVAWGLRNLVDAAAYLPDEDPIRPYLAEKVMNNLKWADTYAQTHITPLSTCFQGQDPQQVQAKLIAIPRPWQNNYVAWSLDHAIRQGFNGGQKLRDRLVRFQLKLFTSPEYPREYAAPYTLVVGKKLSDDSTKYFTTLKEVFQATYGDPPAKPTPFAGYYGVDARLALLIARDHKMEGAQAAYSYLHPKLALDVQQGGLPDLALRPGWAIAPDPAPRVQPSGKRSSPQ